MHAEMMARLEVAGAEGAAEAGADDAAGAGGPGAGGLRGRKQERGPAGSWRGDGGGRNADVTFTPVSAELFAAWRVEWDAEQIRLQATAPHCPSPPPTRP